MSIVCNAPDSPNRMSEEVWISSPYWSNETNRDDWQQPCHRLRKKCWDIKCKVWTHDHTTKFLRSRYNHSRKWALSGHGAVQQPAVNQHDPPTTHRKSLVWFQECPYTVLLVWNGGKQTKRKTTKDQQLSCEVARFNELASLCARNRCQYKIQRPLWWSSSNINKNWPSVDCNEW